MDYYAEGLTGQHAYRIDVTVMNSGVFRIPGIASDTYVA